MGRDVVEIRGVHIDPSAADSQGAGGGTGGGGAGGNPEVVLAPLAKEIARVAVGGGLAGLSEVQCFLAARYVLFSQGLVRSWVGLDRVG